MPAVSRERVSSLLNFIVQLASHIWVLESLGGWWGAGGGGERGLPRAAQRWKRPPPPPPAGVLCLGWVRELRSWGGVSPKVGGAPFQSWAAGGEAGAGAGAVSGDSFIKKEK